MTGTFKISEKNLLLNLLFIISLIILSQTTIYEANAHPSARAGFTLAIGTIKWPYSVAGLFVLPGEMVPLSIESSAEEEPYALNSLYGKTIKSKSKYWQWQAPQEPGLYPLTISNPGNGSEMQLNIFVMYPFSQINGHRFNDYNVGTYPQIPEKNKELYQLPKGFIEVTPANKNTLLSPHFTLGQFLCRQGSDYPQYIALKEKLVYKLESIIDLLNQNGYGYNSLHVMSGYRTPAYNKVLGNVANSRHIWGDAADIFVDEFPRDGIMDDLNKDGKVDYLDAIALYDLIDKASNKFPLNTIIGGLGKYRATSAHGPFVHVDTRGYTARW